MLAAVWGDVLELDTLSVHASFFDLGGHSLMAVSIVAGIHSQLSVEVPLRWVFEHPTIESLGRQMERQQDRSTDSRPIQTADRQQPLPMSFGQQRMWLLQQTLPDPATAHAIRATRNAALLVHDLAGEQWAIGEYAGLVANIALVQ